VPDAPAIAPLVTATSVMLAAYGFLYNTQRDLVARASDLEKKTNADENLRAAKTALRAARAEASLVVAAAVPAGLLTPEVVREIRHANAVGFSLAHYSTIDVIFVVLALSWWVLLLMMALGCGRHLNKAEELYPTAGGLRHLFSNP
jgi:hypothetical protein